MTTKLNPYLSFRDNAREAMQYYQSVFGGELSVNTFEEYHASEDPSENNKVMHSQLESPKGLVLMAADTPNSMDYEQGFSISVSLSGDDEQELRGYWEKLCDGGSIAMPLDTPPWGGLFGMCTDRFGITWMVSIDT